MLKNLNHPDVYTYSKFADADRVAKHIGARSLRNTVGKFVIADWSNPTKYFTFADIQSAIHSANNAQSKEPVMAKSKNTPATTTVKDDLTGDETVVTHNPPAETKATKASKKAKPAAAEDDDLTGDAKPSKKGKKSAIQPDAKFKATDTKAKEGSWQEGVQNAFGRRAAGVTVEAAFANFKFVQPRGERQKNNPRAFFVSAVTGAIKEGFIAAI